MSTQSRREACIISASHSIQRRNVVFVGQGLPVVTSIFAKHSHAPQSVIMNEYGVVDANPPVAIELAHPSFAESATYLCDMVDALGCLIHHVDLAILGAAQIDRYGNVNTTSIGNYFNPKLRISGSGGANDIGASAPKFVILMDRQNTSKFPDRVDYNTTPGFFRGRRNERKSFGLTGGGPEAVFTDIGMYKFSRKSGEMYLEALHEGVSLEEAKEKTGWKLKTLKRPRIIPAPSQKDLGLLRTLDPRGVYLHFAKSNIH